MDGKNIEPVGRTGIGSKLKERGRERREMRASEEQRRGWPREPKGHARRWRQRNEADEA